MIQPRDSQERPREDAFELARRSQLRAACLMVKLGLAPTVSVTCAAVADGAALAVMAGHIARAEGVHASVEVVPAGLTIHFRRDGDEG
ncbi:MAG TPA: hypothetical protein VH859_02690 [Candidatus Limnocylindria bacterium]|jgi:hypothetical protein